MTRKSLWEGVEFNPLLWYYEDGVAIWQLLKKCRKVVKEDTHFYHYYVNPASICSQPMNLRKVEGIMFAENLVFNDINTDDKFKKFREAVKQRRINVYSTLLQSFIISGFTNEEKTHYLQSYLRSNWWRGLKTRKTIKEKVSFVLMLVNTTLTRKLYTIYRNNT